MTVEQIIELLQELIKRGTIKPTSLVVVNWDEHYDYLHFDDVDNISTTQDKLVLNVHTG